MRHELYITVQYIAINVTPENTNMLSQSFSESKCLGVGQVVVYSGVDPPEQVHLRLRILRTCTELPPL